MVKELRKKTEEGGRRETQKGGEKRRGNHACKQDDRRTPILRGCDRRETLPVR